MSRTIRPTYRHGYSAEGVMHTQELAAAILDTWRGLTRKHGSPKAYLILAETAERLDRLAAPHQQAALQLELTALERDHDGRANTAKQIALHRSLVKQLNPL